MKREPGAVLAEVEALRSGDRMRIECPVCRGSGVASYSDGKSGAAVLCGRCKGRGRIVVKR